MTGGERSNRHQLVLVRHAKSSWDDATVPDHDRPLAGRGHKALRRMQAHLEDRRIRPDVVLCSSARRTRETLDGIRDGLGGHPRVEIEDAVYGADAEDLLARLALIDDDIKRVLVIGHNPGIADLVDLLTARDSPTPPPDAVPTGAIAVLSFAGPWRRLGPAAASLDSFWQPRSRADG